MNPIFAAALGSAFFSASIAYHISISHFEIITPLTKWFFDRPGYNLPFILITLLIGSTFTVAGDKGSLVANLLDKVDSWVMSLYASDWWKHIRMGCRHLHSSLPR